MQKHSESPLLNRGSKGSCSPVKKGVMLLDALGKNPQLALSLKRTVSVKEGRLLLCPLRRAEAVSHKTFQELHAHIYAKTPDLQRTNHQSLSLQLIPDDFAKIKVIEYGNDCQQDAHRHIASFSSRHCVQIRRQNLKEFAGAA